GRAGCGTLAHPAVRGARRAFAREPAARRAPQAAGRADPGAAGATAAGRPRRAAAAAVGAADGGGADAAGAAAEQNRATRGALWTLADRGAAVRGLFQPAECRRRRDQGWLVAALGRALVGAPGDAGSGAVLAAAELRGVTLRAGERALKRLDRYLMATVLGGALLALAIIIALLLVFEYMEEFDDIGRGN